MSRLDPAFLQAPIAHRGLHDRASGIVENSRAAFQAAIDNGYGIELDVQGAVDATPLVFHDDHLFRLTGQKGAVQSRPADDLVTIRLSGSDETIPTLDEVLTLVAGQVPLLIEIKDQDGGLGPDVGQLQDHVCDALRNYTGPVALMSFNPHTMARVRAYAPQLLRGLVTDPFFAADWPDASAERLAQLAGIPDADLLEVDFISHNRKDLAAPPVARLKSAGVSILTWTVRSETEEAEARVVADNITFEGYRAVQRH